MFAYIKILNGVHKDKKKIVNTNTLRYFKKETHRKNVKYLMKSNSNSEEDVPVLILLLEETKKELEHKISEEKTRIVGIPTKHLMSASSISSTEDELSKAKEVLKKSSFKTSKTLSDKELESAVFDKVSTFKSTSAAISPALQEHPLKDKTAHSIKSQKHQKLQVTSAATKGNDVALKKNSLVSLPKSPKKPLQEANTQYESDAMESNYENDNSQIQQSKHVKISNYSSNVKENKEDNDLQSNTKVNPKVNDPKSNMLVTHDHSRSELSRPKINNIATITSLQRKVEDLTKINNNLKNKVQSLTDENVQLQKEKDSYKKKYSQQVSVSEKLNKLNQDLQVTIIDHAKEKNEMFEKLAASQSSISMDLNFPAIGFLKTTDNVKKYHIGRNQWLTEKEYNGLINSCKIPSLIAGNILTLVFDTEELMTSTKSGIKSKKAGGKATKCNKLDEVKFGACEDFYLYWMKNIYQPTKEEKQCFQSDLLRFSYYAGKKVAELKRPPRPRKAPAAMKRKRRESPESEAEYSCDNELDIDSNVHNRRAKASKKKDGTRSVTVKKSVPNNDSESELEQISVSKETSDPADVLPDIDSTKETVENLSEDGNDGLYDDWSPEGSVIKSAGEDGITDTDVTV